MRDLRDQVLAEVRRIFATELEREGPVEPSHRLAADLGVDSLGAVVLAVGLEDRFRIALTEEETTGVVTVDDLVAVVVRRLSADGASAGPAHGAPSGEGPHE